VSFSAPLVRLKDELTNEEDAVSSNSKVAVAGATGRVGRHVVDVLTERGQEVVPISRSTGVDVITGEGLPEALSGADVVIDAATGPLPDGTEATEFFVTGRRTCRRSGRRPA
jgi:glutamate dehydrogenase/leucine dehydrogenase